MVAVFGGVGLFVLLALAIGAARCAARAEVDACAPSHGGGSAALRAARRAHAAATCTSRGRDCVTGARGAHAVATPASSRNVLRFRAVLRVDMRRDAVSLRRNARAVRVHEPAGVARHARAASASRSARQACCCNSGGRDPALSDASNRDLDRAFICVAATDSASPACCCSRCATSAPWVCCWSCILASCSRCS